MENRKGNGIFLGIVSVATLIVAIIGATFAYFSASTESNEGAVGATAYEYSLTLSVFPVYPEGIAPALIPMDADGQITVAEDAGYTGETENLWYALNRATNPCVDDNGLQVCALYRVEIVNDAVNDITLSGKLITNTNTAADDEGRTPFKNLTYQALERDLEASEDYWVIKEYSPVTIAETEGDEIPIADIFVPGATVNEDGETEPGKGISYVLIYLEEAGDGQSSEMGASFTGQLEYSSGTGDGSKLTGSFTVAAPKTDEGE